ncbi:MAG: RNA 2',3'-cyclic phosphodiesterase, partial [Myxococcales bacterium]|nr:RNA 2',3'-cyclic phosphodiesterase [Myxococcales bacterium]
MVAAGLPPEERPFRPHLTLGRVKGGPPPVLDGIATPEHEAFSADAVVLLRSEL